MKNYETITKDELRELLVTNWMTHDAMWLTNMAAQYGMEATNKINKTAARTMAKAEAKRIKKLLGVGNPQNMAELDRFITSGFQLTHARFIGFSFSFSEPNTVVWHIPRCFAFEGMTRAGTIAQYDCGIKDRLFGWFDELNVRFEMLPPFSGCQMHQTGKCEMVFKVEFGG